jgi:hypothetical protein
MIEGPLDPAKFKKIEEHSGNITLKQLCRILLESDSMACSIVLPKPPGGGMRVHAHVALCAAEDSDDLRQLIHKFLTERMT